MVYDMILPALPFIGGYLFTYSLYKMDIIKKALHVNIWNFIIGMAFLISAGAGLVLLGLVEYGIALPISQELLYWHVQFAIAMFWIAIFHIHSYWMSPSSEKPGTESSNKSNTNKTRKKADNNHTSGSSTPPEKEAPVKNQGRELD